MNWLWPKLRRAWLPPMFGSAALGALIAGLYGIAHDQLTYAISPEYFTRLKFTQFHWANLGFSPRVFVVEIGFLATWWVGFFAGWTFARVIAPIVPPARILPLCLRGFPIVLGLALAAAGSAFVFGRTQNPQPATSGIADLAASLGVVDVPAFVRVAYIHNASYLGGLLGVIVAAVVLKRKARQIAQSRT